MEEFRKEAKEYYRNSSTEVKAKAIRFFNLLDSDGNSSIDVTELASFIKGFKILSRLTTPEELITSIDRNGNGSLDFNEFITFFYMIFSLCQCDGCGAKLLGQGHVTCAKCFCKGAGDTFDLCSTCYSTKNFAHKHTCFLNFEALLFAMAAECKKEEQNRSSKKQSEGSKGMITEASLKQLETVHKVSEFSLEVVHQMTSAGCSIM